MPHSHVITAIVEHKLRIVLVDCVVSQMDVWFFQVGSGRFNIGLSCKASQAFIVHVEPQGIGAAKQNINPQIELQPL